MRDSDSLAVLQNWQSVAGLIDHTLLKPDATRDQIAQLCQEAAHFHFATVCVQPTWVEVAVQALAGTGVRVGTVIGFPHGATFATVKKFEAEQAVRMGARELDVVINVGALKSGERKLVQDELQAVVEVAHGGEARVKAILETPLLTTDQKIAACQASLVAGVDFVKTATGFGGGGATIPDVMLLRATVGSNAGVKASGGIRTAADVRNMVVAGANRIGTSAGVRIVQELGAPGYASAPSSAAC